jgi:hypothetical protein
VKTPSRNIFFKSLLLFSVLAVSQSIAMELSEEIVPFSSSAVPKSTPLESPDDFIEGDLCIFLERPTYAAGFYDYEKELLTLDDKDVMFKVWAASKESPNWRSIKHPRLEKFQEFPLYLPYRLLQGKMEKDVITIPMYGKVFILHLNQSNSRYDDYGRFENAVQAQIQAFLEDPNYILNEKENLLKKGILAKNGDKICHGPNGFKDE